MVVALDELFAVDLVVEVHVDADAVFVVDVLVAVD